MDWTQEEALWEDPQEPRCEMQGEETGGAIKAGWEDIEAQKPHTDREWGAWRKKTRALAQRLAQEELRRMEEGQSGGEKAPAAEAYVPGEEDAQGEAAPEGEAPEPAGAPRAPGEEAPVGIADAALAKGQALLGEQLAQIALLEPAVQSLADLARMENFAQFDSMVRAGYDLVTAFKVANYESAGRRRAAAARQAALNAAASKRHMTHLPAAAAAEGGEEIPAAALGVWREMFPEESEAKLRARYNRALRGE